MSDLIRKAIDFAAKAHLGQVRKGTDLPYITHPFNVGLILVSAGCPEPVCAAGFLHDTLEDTDATDEELTREFGQEIAGLVSTCSEPDKSHSWKARKEHTIHSLENASLQTRLVTIADKLHNLLTMEDELAVVGDSHWNRFKAGKEDQGWYYRSVLKALLLHKDYGDYRILLTRLETQISKVFK